MATDNLLFIMENHPNWLLCPKPPTASTCIAVPIYTDAASVDIKGQSEEDWLSASVISKHLACDPGIQQPAIDESCHSWALLYHFHTWK